MHNFFYEVFREIKKKSIAAYEYSDEAKILRTAKVHERFAYFAC